MKKSLFIIAISFSPLIQADYVIKFSSQPLSVPAKTVPSIVVLTVNKKSPFKK